MSSKSKTNLTMVVVNQLGGCAWPFLFPFTFFEGVSDLATRKPVNSSYLSQLGFFGLQPGLQCFQESRNKHAGCVYI